MVLSSPVCPPTLPDRLHVTWEKEVFFLHRLNSYAYHDVQNKSVCVCVLMEYGLQCYVNFCCTVKWISYMYTDSSSLLRLPHPHPTALGRDGAQRWAPCAMQQAPLAICFTDATVYISGFISQFIPRSLPSHVCMSILYACVSMSVPWN